MSTKLVESAGKLFGKVAFIMKKHSPEILMGLGIAGTVGSTVLACQATRKIDSVLDEKNARVETIHEKVEDEENTYTKEDSKKDLTMAYVDCGISLFRLYAPAIGLGLVSISSIIAGHKILSKRNVSIAAAYAVVDQSFKDYRKRVVEKFGDDVDKELRYNIVKKTITETYKDENGEIKTREVEVNSVDMEDDNPLAGISEYAKFFDASSDQHKKDPEYNLMFLRRQQDYANEILKSRAAKTGIGHLFLNEVYDMLGLPRTKAGQMVGWIYNKKNPTGDNYVDFGIYDPKKLANRMFVNGFEYNILLDFNVDGVIYDLI